MIDFRLINVILCGLAFLFLMIANQTVISIEAIVIPSVNREFANSWGQWRWNAFQTLGLNFAVNSIFGWFSPSIVAILGPKFSLCVSALAIWLINFIFLFPFYFGLTLYAIISGAACAVLWTAVGTFLAVNSDLETVSRNSAIFWILYSSSMISGNFFIVYEFQGHEEIDSPTRNMTFSLLIACSAVGVFLLLLLRERKSQHSNSEERVTAWKAFCHAVSLMKSKDMALIIIMYIYLGIVVSFFTGVYSASIGFTQAFGRDRKKYSGLSGVAIGTGGVVGGSFILSTAILKKCSKFKFHGKTLVLIGYAFHMVSFVLIFLNLPAEASLRECNQPAIIPSRLGIALLVSFMLGLGDSLIESPVIALISTMYGDNSAPAFAISNFMYSLASGILFFISDYIDLHIHTYILIITASCGTLALLKVYIMNDERNNNKIEKSNEYKLEAIKPVAF